MNVSEFDFNLPESLIAQHPVEPRDTSRLMVVNRDHETIDHHRFRDLVPLLKSGDVLVVNNTRVIPARLIGVKEGTEVKIEVLLLKRLELDVWEALIKPGKRLKLGQKVHFGQGILEGVLEGILENGNRKIVFNYAGVFETILDLLGKMPLPPYITAQLEDQERYQTVYAKERGSVAAPTAGLHFTPELLNQLRKKGVEIVEILLHVGLGTFRPVKMDDIRDHEMHSEYYRVDLEAAERINCAKREGRRVIAVGTTAARTLESVGKDGKVIAGVGWTDIFIYPGYSFQIVDALLTNFHFPKSTLVMLVSALAGRELILKAYEIAVQENYRFYSFGDAMLIL
ncbi:tRNA preQ1(34) S-adenosylmethionine ribosyltransferase-isomerase QueA [Desulfosporosinus sp. BICA1-9]|uniref:tRNA preQ1(34) S-adenosylmethionine ribosyltransferase-isomerase QueA n=1 Tax=Desulfosporosinus sp. BICA1-9 TaxID=1531958 RepID=UPI00054C5314|nr:tRNA preQ1(34) S-adenosylmethionine ribosyltransferase-isomerase QueA [Desulfosporosinus sp. BICA1-9]KJS48433.1 MAG: S-adenosylmethionine tRNA ribosyltransferase [Peptococcaceae bacterium BRH_c23]KJS77958.1 MAG: S-adenosylmethionine tRNA ribosyltransferase [Desulfosporosinus sp. BICA1-9]HBW35062.1 S-adenosylmethionine:tRNA ribosyltransferase-isomerase [Desulfosporosinus sp.]